jgi:uncharacterized protein YqeY
MTLKETIIEQQKEAMKAGEKDRVSVLRMLAAAIKQAEIDSQSELSDIEVTQLVKRQVKQLLDASKEFEAAGRTDLVEQYAAEIAILEAFLPEQLSDEELTSIIEETIETMTSGETTAQFGQIMGAAMKTVSGRADGNRVRTIIEKLLK